MEPLLLISEKLKSIQDGTSLQKGKGNRDGLIQQIVTYVRDGHTVTRKQWVRSEFADHAKKNEEEKKDTMLKEEERHENKRRNELKEQAEKQHTADKRAAKKVAKQKEKEEAHGRTGRNKKVDTSKVDAYKKRWSKNVRKTSKNVRKMIRNRRIKRRRIRRRGIVPTVSKIRLRLTIRRSRT
jgi:hypothetical protein